MIGQVIVYLAFIEAMITTGEHIQTQRKQLFRNQRCDAKAARTILRIGNRQTDFVFRLDSW